MLKGNTDVDQERRLAQLDRDLQTFEGVTFNELLQKTYQDGADQILAQNPSFLECFAELGIEPKDGR